MIKIAWDDTQSTGTDIDATEWNSMVTYIKSAIDSSDSIDVSSGTINALTVSTVTISTDNITGITTGTSNNDTLATKGYVDDNSGGGGGGSGSPMLTLSIDGALSTGNKGFWVIPDDYNALVVKEVRLICLGLPTGADIQVDIRKNGTASTDSIFTSDVPTEIPTGQTTTNGVYQTACDTSGARVGTPGTTIDSARDDLATDDVLYVYIAQVGSTVSGADLRVQLTLGSA